MKRQLMQLAIVSSVAALSVGVARANDEDQSGHWKHEKNTEKSSSTQASEVRLSKLMDADIKSKSDEDLGKLEDLMINPNTGKIDFAVIGRGGFLGLGEKLVPVPWQAVTVQSEKQFTLNVDKQKLQSAPTIDKKYSAFEQPDYAVTIYRFYSIPVGTGETPGGTEQGQSQQSGSTSTPQSGSTSESSGSSSSK